MKKSLRTVILVFLSMVLIFGSASSVWAEVPVFSVLKYPVPEEITDDPDVAWHWWNHWRTNCFDDISDYANLWYMFAPFSEGNEWDSRFLNHFQRVFDEKLDTFNPELLGYSDMTLYGTSWIGRTLSVDFSVTFDVVHSVGSIGEYFSNHDRGYIVLTVVITDKESGKIVDMGSAGKYIPKLAEWYTHPYIQEEYAGSPDVLEYSTTTRKTTDILMHDTFDPAVQDVTLVVTYFNDLFPYPHTGGGTGYYCYTLFNDSYSVDTSGFTAITGDADGNGTVNLQDVSLILKHCADWELGSFFEDSADVTCDGEVNLTDAQVAMKIVCGWDLSVE